MQQINVSVASHYVLMLAAYFVSPAATASPQDAFESAQPFQPRYVEVDEFNMGPPWLFDRREPSPGLLNGGFYDPDSIYRHHGGGIGTTHHVDGPYRHHDMGHAYYDDPASMKRFHGLGDGGAQRRGQYHYRRHFIEKYWYERGSSCFPCVPLVPGPPPHDARHRDNPSSRPPVTQPSSPPIFFYEPPGGEQVEPIPLEEIPNRTWVMLNEGDAESAMLMFAIDAARSPENVDAKVGFAIASAMTGRHDRAAMVMCDALDVDGDALDRPEIGPALRSRIARLAAGLDDDVHNANDDGVLVASLHALGGQLDQARNELAMVFDTHPDDSLAMVLAQFLDDAESRRMAAAHDFAADVLMMLPRSR